VNNPKDWNKINGIKNYTSIIVPGNAFNKTNKINRKKAKTAKKLGTSVNNRGSIDAYPLVEGKILSEIDKLDLESKMPSKKRLTPTSIMVVDTISSVKSRT